MDSTQEDREGLEDFMVAAIQLAITSAGHRLPAARLPALTWFHSGGFDAACDLLEISEQTRARIREFVRQRSVDVKERYQTG